MRSWAVLVAVLVGLVAVSGRRRGWAGLRRSDRSSAHEDNDSLAVLEDRRCIIEVREVRRLPGKCMTLLGGRKACQSDTHLDPLTNQCGDV